MEKQTDLFGAEIEQNNTTEIPPILITTDSKSKQTTTTDKINKKIKKIDALKHRFEKAKKELSVIKEVYYKKITPLETDLFNEKEVFVCKLYERYCQSGFTMWQTRLMEEVIQNECQFLFANEYESDKLIKVHQAIEKAQSERISPFEKDFRNSIAKDFLTHLGVEIDDDEPFNFEDFMDNKESQEEFQQKQHESQKAHDALHKKDKVLNTDKQFQKLYKTLVKKAHPDLVTSQEEKEKREVLMKKLSEAWHDRDYYKLLLIKTEIEKSNNETVEIEIDESQSKSLIKQLDEQIKDLESDYYNFKNLDQENNFYFENFGHKSTNSLEQKIHKYTTYLKDQKEQTLTESQSLKSKVATKSLLKSKRDERFEDEPDDFYNLF